MQTYVQLGRQSGSRFAPPPRLRRRERKPLLSLALITAMLLSGLWLGARVGAADTPPTGPDPFQLVGR